MRKLRQLIFSYVLLIVAFPIHALELKRVILSTDNNRNYIEFWPIVAPIWQAMGLRPTLALIADENCPIDTSLGDVFRFDPLVGIQTSLQAQVMRLILPVYFPDEGCLISDIDMIPIDRSYFFDGASASPDDALLVYRDSVPGWQKYPMCYVAAKGAVFNSLFEIDKHANFEEIIRKWEQQGYGWGTDENILYNTLLSWETRGGHVTRLGHSVGPRLDRGEWKSDFSSVNLSDYIDCHCPRPYSEYQQTIDQVVQGVMCLLHPPTP